ncbi:MAG TPA: hypothetical protein VI011_19625 [Asanoa sp.]
MLTAIVGTLVARAALRVVADSPPAPGDAAARRGALFHDASGPAMAVRSTASGVVQAVHIRGLVAVGRRAFEPLVALSVAVILYDAGLALELRQLRGPARAPRCAAWCPSACCSPG